MVTTRPENPFLGETVSEPEASQERPGSVLEKPTSTTIREEPGVAFSHRFSRHHRNAPGRSRRASGPGGWILAGLFGLLSFFLAFTPSASLPTVPELQQRLVSEAEDLVRLVWKPVDGGTAERSVGELVWSDERQEGYMRFEELAPNDPGVQQYQLWIVDPERDARPVDGGVFDVPQRGRSPWIPIRARLDVRRPEIFAITLEKPGGVVVSESPLLLTASPDSPPASGSSRNNGS